MTQAVTDLAIENVHENLAHDKEKHPQENGAHGPIVVQGKDDKNNLRHYIQQKHDGIDDIVDHKHRGGLAVVQRGVPALEGDERHHEVDQEPHHAHQPQRPHGLSGPVLPELEADDPVEEQRHAHSTRKPELNAHKVRVRRAGRRWHSAIDD